MDVKIGEVKTLTVTSPATWKVVEDWLASITPSEDQKSCVVKMISPGATEVIATTADGKEKRVRFDISDEDEELGVS